MRTARNQPQHCASGGARRGKDRRRLWGLVLRVALPSALSIVLFSVVVFAIILPELEHSLLARKKEVIRELTQTACTVLARYEHRVQNGELTRPQAQALALEHIRDFRYGEHSENYFWVNDMHARMIMHPYRPDLEGQDLTKHTDPTGKCLFVEFVNAVSEGGSGYVSYMWQWKDDSSRIVPKLSYVQLFRPWNWVVGTGIYVEDVAAEIRGVTRKLGMATATILALVTLLSAFVIWQSLQFESRRRQTKDQLRESQRSLATLMSNLPGMAYRCRIEPSRSMEFVSEGCLALTGRKPEALVGDREVSYGDLIRPEDRVRVWSEIESALNEGRPFQIAYRLIDAVGEQRWVWEQGRGVHHDNGVPQALEGIVIDITQRQRSENEKKELQDQLHQAQKMEAVGQLAGGVAHDFNNLLTVILSSVETLKGKYPADDAGRAALDAIERAAVQATGVTRSLLTFSHKLPADKQPVSLSEVIDKAGRLLQRVLPTTVELSLETSDDPPQWCNADATQLTQVILNLAINARDAMPGGGTLRLVLRPATPDDLEGGADSPAAWACITVSDTGTGMPPDVLARIFEPFFTTKARGEGTGLGLAVVHSIVEDHGGRIRVFSVPGQGTTFRILLPGLEATAANEPEHRLGRGELLILAEENRHAREIMAAKLRSVGYRVVQVEDGFELVTCHRTHGEKIRLLIISSDLPRRTGVAALREIRAAGGDMPAILVTDSMGPGTDEHVDARTLLLRKPFQMSELGRLADAILHQGMLWEADS